MKIKNKILRVIEEPKSILFKFKGLNANSYFHILSLKRFSKDIKMMIDVGANKGDYIKSFKSEFPESKVIAFEPIIEFSNELNKLNIINFNIGLWDRNIDNARFYYNKKSPHDSSFFEYTNNYSTNSKTEERKVAIRRFDSLNLKIESPCFLKIDVEGAEYNVLKGFGKKLDEIDFILLEFLFQDNFKKGNDFWEVVKLLKEHGFIGFSQKTLNYQKGMPNQADFLFFRFNKI